MSHGYFLSFLYFLRIYYQNRIYSKLPFQSLGVYFKSWEIGLYFTFRSQVECFYSYYFPIIPIISSYFVSTMYMYKIFFLSSLCTINMLSSPANAPSSFCRFQQVTTISEKIFFFHPLLQMEWVCLYFSLRTLTIGQCPVEVVVQVGIIVHLGQSVQIFIMLYIYLLYICVPTKAVLC